MITKTRLPLVIISCLMLAVMVFGVLPIQAAIAQTTSQTFHPSADAYVKEQEPDNNFGTAENLRVDSSPVVRSYLRFDVSGLNGAVESARLRIYANSNGNGELTVNALGDNSWKEDTINYSNAPAPGNAIQTSAEITGGQWVEVDITGSIPGDGTYSLVLSTSGSANTSLGSRESGNPPELVIVSGTPEASAPTATEQPPAPTATEQPPAPTATQPPAPTATQPPAPTATKQAADTVVEPLAVTAAGTITAGAAADAYVLETSPSTSFGTATNMRVDSTPITRSYLRFNVSGLNGATVTSAKLRIYANSSNTSGFTVNRLANNTWTESGLVYSNAPAPGTAIKTSPAIVAGQWVETDITGYVTADGPWSMVLTTTSGTNTSFGSRESGANAPQLVITSGTSTVPTPTSVPGLTKVNLSKGPTLIYTGSNTSMKIFWQWTSNTSFRVDWGTTTAYGKSSATVSAYDATNHIYAYTISGLAANTKYYYRVVAGSQYSPGSFRTAPAATATTLKFISYGDTRTNPGSHNTVAGKVNALYQSDAGFQTVNAFVGDMVTDGNTESYWTSQFFSNTYPNIRTEVANLPLLPIMGNHEGSGTLFKRYFPEPFVAARYWSVDYGPAHFIMLDQYTSYSSGSAQYNWLKSDLAATTKKWKIIVLHEPGWSAGGGHSNNTTVQTVLEPLFEQYKVAMVLGGHNHYYARASVNGIQHLTVGTGGAPLYSPASGQPNIVKTYKGYGYTKFSISGTTLTGTFVDTAGTVRDTFTVTR